MNTLINFFWWKIYVPLSHWWYKKFVMPVILEQHQMKLKRESLSKIKKIFLIIFTSNFFTDDI